MGFNSTFKGLKLLRNVSVQSPSSGRTLFELAKASSNNALPGDGDYSETCRSCFKVNFNVDFNIDFKTVHLCIIGE